MVDPLFAFSLECFWVRTPVRLLMSVDLPCATWPKIPMDIEGSWSGSKVGLAGVLILGVGEDVELAVGWLHSGRGGVGVEADSLLVLVVSKWLLLLRFWWLLLLLWKIWWWMEN
jgi:hypothetical protein